MNFIYVALFIFICLILYIGNSYFWFIQGYNHQEKDENNSQESTK